MGNCTPFQADWEEPEAAEKWRQVRVANANAAEAPPAAEPTAPKPPGDIPLL